MVFSFIFSKEKRGCVLNYAAQLKRYFDKHYGEYEYSAAWYVNPAPNMWKFEILELNRIVTLICDEDGRVTEEREKLYEQL